ncbi:MAG TPA: TetR/AcrR family transcriptional regulator [Candidatus Limnocylindria bacterium]|nr:TetR/AcrR family transcriptional regulator [Candidatus Limnocylindria bacterium]
MAQVVAAVRRTQAERSAATRAQLLDATLVCLQELGYARTTTTEIARRAGVSRGAQLHHFPTKVELVTQAVGRLFERRRAEFLAAIEQLPAGPSHRLDAAIDLLWSMVKGPTFLAWLELAVAARTDAELAGPVTDLTHRFGLMVDETFRRLFPGDPQNPFFDVAPRFAFALLDGLALERLHIPDDAAAERVVQLLKRLAALVMPLVADETPPRGGTP